jgi:hypothetical protein
VLIGVDSSPTLGVDYQPSSPTWGGEPNIGDDDTVLVAGEGIFLEELRAELDARGLPMPRRTGIRHWFPDYDETEERARLLALLEGPAGTAAATATNAQTVAGPQTGADPRSGRIAVVADSLFLEHLDRLEGEGVGIMQLPPATASETTAVEWIRQTAEQVVAYLRVDYEVSLIDDGAWGQTLDMALAELGERPLSRA